MYKSKKKTANNRRFNRIRGQHIILFRFHCLVAHFFSPNITTIAITGGVLCIDHHILDFMEYN
jgi:hypothetical protein